ncbi:DNA repair ATPase [Streptomyces sp. Rer75]|uniref:DNA repair ATPase n=1 Tax=Streptomyces sp. Rer75 TaxID=2750011 RepID=UPI0015D0AFC2|nr:DNA repair ATPase [Streptomyces sp. Rer75]
MNTDGQATAAPRAAGRTSQDAASPAGGPGAGLQDGTYEVLRDRLLGAARELGSRARALDERRVEVFGDGALDFTGTGVLRTAQPTVVCDLVQVGGLLLCGHNTPSTEVADVGDVFTLFHRADGGFRSAAPDALAGLLDDDGFQRDFAELYRYYRSTRLLRLRRTGPYLLAVFRTGERPTDIRVLRWRIAADGTPAYLDAKGERDHVLPPSHDVTWIATTRNDHVLGRHPHIRVADGLYVATVGGTLTVKTEDDTETGEGVYAEPVEEPLQSLADAEVDYACAGPLLLLRIRPYNEPAWRHLVFNTRTREVLRLDGVGQACRLLPDGQGIVFPGGYYLATGAVRTFETDTTGLGYERAVRSPGGEDTLFVFHAEADGRVLLLPYNVIRQEVAAPIVAHGWALFDDGALATLTTAPGEPARAHQVQLWTTPYLSETYAVQRPPGTGPLARIGNPELVRGISGCLSLARMAHDMAPGQAVFEAIGATAKRVADSCHWLADPELGSLGEPVESIRATAARVTEEFRRIAELRHKAAETLGEATARITTLVRRVRGEQPGTADGWVRALTELRQEQGRLETLRDIRYLDLEQLDALAAGLNDDLAAAGRRAAAFLSGEDAFAATHQAVAALTGEAAVVATVADATPVAERIDEHADGLRVVTDVIATLDLADATVRTSVLSRAGEVLGAVNQARATLDARRRELRASEGRAEFAAELALLGQAVAGALAAATTPEECDEQLGRLLSRIEDIEARFGDVDAHEERIATQREEIHEAFSARRQTQLDERARRARRLADSARRLITTLTRRARSLGNADEVATFFASDPLVSKVRATADELRATGDPARAGELDGGLTAARQEATRALRDRADLYDGTGTIRLGRHRFTVPPPNQRTDLTLVPHDGALAFAITGTDYLAAVTDPALTRHQEFWDQPLISESPEVYRSEHLAATLLEAAEEGGTGAWEALSRADEATLLAEVSRAAASRYDEGYDRGVHDHDAARILTVLLRLRAEAGPLRFAPEVRAAAQLFWAYGTEERARALWTTRAQSFARARGVFGHAPGAADLRTELGAAAAGFLPQAIPDLAAASRDHEAIGAYLVEELADGPPRFATSAEARTLIATFRTALGGDGSPGAKEFTEDLRALSGDLAARYQLAASWLGGHAEASGLERRDLAEAAAIEVCGTAIERHDIAAPLAASVDDLLGTHSRVAGGTMPLRLDEFLTRTTEFRRLRVPAYRSYTRKRTELLAAERERLRLDAYQPKVLSSFVRNRLVDEVYLPLAGDNLARQLGADGDGRRTDSQGLLLLLSPPGYGKTTLVEYVASRLGLLFVKVDGPALGRRTDSLDPAAAPDAAARREVEKINFALEMGNNVLLHLDDIQHTSPELLQKFIPLGDAQRRVEGVRDGQARTYDLRGKRFAVCMAGNPYTESGQRFRIPDMLANRADIWNLGDVLSGKEELFVLSHIENALTSHPVLAPLASRDRGDIDLLVRLARADDGDEGARPDRLTRPCTPAELDEILSVLRKLLHIQKTVLAVNRAYIASAAQADASRTEPPFRLQGSYRDTNKLAARIVPAMNDAELEALIDDHYRAEAQTLTGDAEANLLKLAKLRGRLTAGQAARWNEVKQGYLRRRPVATTMDTSPMMLSGASDGS